jgi:hypothetical protein
MIRYGCFLPDLTGLARHPSTASLSGSYIDYHSPQRKAAGGFLHTAKYCQQTDLYSFFDIALDLR